MITHPTADELLSAAAAFITRVTPELKDRDVFLARVAVNAIGVVQRELEDGPALNASAAERLSLLLGKGGAKDQLDALLSEEIRSGAFDDRAGELLAHLKASAIAQLKIDQPTYSGLKAALSDD